MPDKNVIQAVVDLADEQCHPFQLAAVIELPLHVKALREVTDGSLQHHCITSAHHQITVVEADSLHVN